MLEKHTCKLIRKLCTAGTAVLENTAVKNRKKHSYNKVSYNYPGSPIQADHNIQMHYLFCLVVLAEENSRKPLLLVTYRNQVFLYFHFYLKNKKVSKIPHFSLILHEV